ncbi:MAG: glycosyltransferase, partial [Steroidobacterales bacterium]
MMWSPPLNEDFQPAIDPQQKCVDIIVPVFKNIALTSRCIESLASHLREIAHCSPRMILVNDSPGEPDVRELLNEFSARHPNVVVLESDRNRGFVASANQGLRMALESGRDAILVNSDTQTFDGTLGNLIEAAYSDAQIGFASPRTNNAALCSLPHFAHTLAVSPEVAYQQWKAVSRTLPRLHFAPTAVGYYLFIKYGVLA